MQLYAVSMAVSCDWNLAYSCNRLPKAVIVKLNYFCDSEKRLRNGRPVAQDVARYLPNCLAASICRRITSSELHAAGAYRHGERQEVQRQGGHGRRLAFNLHVNGSPHLAGETYHAFTFRRCMHARLIHRSFN